MVRKINKYINLSIITSIFFILLGMIILFFPKTMFDIFSISISMMAIITGVYLIILEVRTKDRLFPIDSALSGTLILVLGIICIMHLNLFQTFIPVLLGIWFITGSVIKFKLTFILKNANFSMWLLSLIMTLLSIICGLIFILEPVASSKIITLYVGIIMIIYSIVDMCEMFIVKRNINLIDKKLKERIKIID